jgi:hypothetical protein
VAFAVIASTPVAAVLCELREPTGVDASEIAEKLGMQSGPEFQ